MIPIAFRESRYAVTEQGEIINLVNGFPLTPVINPNGYYKVSLANGDGTSEQISIHRLVAKHFLPNPYEYPQVNHKDGNKINNAVSNLEWCSSKQNASHALSTNLRPGYMSAKDRDDLINRVFAGEKIADLAVEIGRGQESLAGMLRRRTEETGIRDKWDQTMKERRRETTTLRNKTFSRSKGNPVKRI